MEIDILIDKERYAAVVTEYPAKGNLPRRYEIEIEEGISINDFDAYGDNLVRAWIFPADSVTAAIDEFVRLIRAERIKNT